jgi:hypothetical protein
LRARHAGLQCRDDVAVFRAGAEFVDDRDFHDSLQKAYLH